MKRLLKIFPNLQKARLQNTEVIKLDDYRFLSRRRDKKNKTRDGNFSAFALSLVGGAIITITAIIYFGWQIQKKQFEFLGYKDNANKQSTLMDISNGNSDIGISNGDILDNVPSSEMIHKEPEVINEQSVIVPPVDILSTDSSIPNSDFGGGNTFGGDFIPLNPEDYCIDCEVYDVQIRVTHYNPYLGGDSCWAWNNESNYCDSGLFSGIRWETMWGLAAACPFDWPIGSWVYLPGYGGVICLDRGTMVCVGNICEVDILIDDLGALDGQVVDAKVYINWREP